MSDPESMLFLVDETTQLKTRFHTVIAGPASLASIDSDSEFVTDFGFSTMGDQCNVCCLFLLKFNFDGLYFLAKTALIAGLPIINISLGRIQYETTVS